MAGKMGSVDMDYGQGASLIELGLVIIGLAILARLANRFAFSAIPLYLLTGLAFGEGGILPLRFSGDVVGTGAEVGVILLLFMLGLEYSGSKLVSGFERGLPYGIVDFLLNFLPGLAAGLILGFEPSASLLLGGITYISSSGIVSKVLSELKPASDASVRLTITVLVLEDLAMAVYLPIVSVLLSGISLMAGVLSALGAVTIVFGILWIAVRFGRRISAFVSHQSDEVLLLSILGLVLLVSGALHLIQISAAVGAFIVGVAVSGPIVHRARRLISPFRDLFAAIFFFFFGLQIDPSTLPSFLVIAILLGIVTGGSKIVTGLLCGRRAGLTKAEALHTGALLVPRGEFSVVIAGLGSTVEPKLGPLTAAYVLILGVAGPLLAKMTCGGRPLSQSEA